MKTLRTLIAALALIAIYNNQSIAQLADPPLPSASDDEWDEAYEYTNPDKGEYWDFNYDPCTGILKYVFYVWETGETDELKRMFIYLKKQDETLEERELIFNWYLDLSPADVTFLNENGGYSNLNLDLAASTETTHYLRTSRLINVKQRKRGEDIFVQFEYYLGEEYLDQKTYINFDVQLLGSEGIDEITWAGIHDQEKSSLTPQKLEAPISSPTVNKYLQGSSKGNTISFNLTGCTGTYGVDNGPYYQILRYEQGNNTPEVVVTARYSNTPVNYNDELSQEEQCKSYSYSVRTLLKSNGASTNHDESAKSSYQAYTTILDEPYNLAATTTSCDGSIKLTWVWSESNPDGFVIERKKSNESVYTEVSRVEGSKREYSDPIATADLSTDISYRIRTETACGLTPTNDLTVVQGRALAPLLPPTGVVANVVSSGGGKIVRLGWNDNSDSESKYIITRQFAQGGGLVTIELDANATSYDDLNVSICQPYRYQVRVVNNCAPNGVFDESEVAEVTIDADISEVVSETSLTASRGYFKDRVTLNWVVGGEFDFIDRYKIYNRPLGSDQEPVLVGIISGIERTYDDVKADAGQLLEYFLIGETDCGESTLITNNHSDLTQATRGVARAVGFRSPEGVINGNISYSGGNPVKDVKVIVSNESGALGQSLSFDGNSSFTISDSGAQLNPKNNNISVAMYVKPDEASFGNSEVVLLEKDQSFKLSLNFEAKIVWNLYDGSSYLNIKTDATIPTDEFTQVYATYDGTTAKIYLNGILDKEATISTNLSAVNTNSLLVGEDYVGLIDEISVWEVARTAESIARDHVRKLNTTETGMIGYWPINVGYGNMSFDASKVGNAFNGHDAQLNGTTWSSEIPTIEQLSTIGYTNAQGNYTINGVRFRGSGENFIVTPTLGVHEFSPDQKIIYIGDGNLVQNGVDFEDNSSFRVTGRVVFDYKNLDVGSEGVRLLIDGQPILNANAEILKTDQDGNFELDVPIGEHVITVQKDDHVFQYSGRFPIASGTKFNFNEPLSGLTFYDQTQRKLIGKVVGGTREGDKPIGFERTNNNIGVATFILKSKDGLISEPVETDVNTGEYEINLPPKVYDLIHPIDESVGKIRVASSNLKINASSVEIDLLTEYEPDYEYDTVAFADNIPLPQQAQRIDTIANGSKEVRRIPYDYKVNHIYRRPAEVFVFDGKEQEEKEFVGDRELKLADTEGNAVLVSLVDDNGNYLLPNPLVQQNHTYRLLIKVQELYTNNDSGSPVIDKVPVKDAKILLENNMMTPYYKEDGQIKPYPRENNVPVVQLNQIDGDTTILFRAEEPEFTKNDSDANLSYTKNFKLTVIAGGNITNWPNPANQNVSQPIYVLGDKSSENFSFVTAGPAVVKHIIRDPYGGESFAYLEKGSTISRTTSLSLASNEDTSVDGALGYKGFGAAATVTGGLASSKNYSENGSITTEITTTQVFETNFLPEEVGAGGDLYIAESNNYEAGFSDRLKFVDISFCGLSDNIQCLEGSPTISKDGHQFRLAKTYAAYISPEGSPTTVIYSQNHIELVLIPDLINVRNSLLSNTEPNAEYISKIPSTHELFGTNNDDLRWGNVDNDPLDYNFELDSDGPSYTFRPLNDDVTRVDSVAILNQEIRLWKEAIARNEKAKIAASQLPSSERRNFSLGAGGSIEESIESSRTESYEQTYGLASSFSAGYELDVDPDNTGVVFNLTANFTLKETVEETEETEETSYTIYGFELFDPDVGDFVSVDVIPGENGNGPIFILQGGETSCPHEEAYTTRYFEPGTVIGKSTFQRDKPRIDVDVAQLYNVPADGKAAFNLTLSNDSESKDGFNYTMFVIEESNPDGAIISMDGEFFDRNRSIYINGASSIRKTVTLEKGPFEYDYEDIKIVIASICQSDPTDFEKIIADTVSISSYFLPICTTPEILSPDDNWTLNNRFDNQMEVLIGDYDINFPGFEYLELQYKTSESSSWIPVQRFYRDLAASGDPDDGIQIPRNNPNIAYNWDVSQILDGNYDLRVVSDCEVLSTGGRVKDQSAIKSGIIDRINPHLFGSPQPGDGILSPGDEISIQFNEPINAALLSPANFSIRGVLNGGALNHNVSLSFDGTENSYVELVNPPNIKSRNFTIDFWAKRNSNGEEVIIHQGASESQVLQIGFNQNDALYFEMNGDRFTTSISVNHQVWAHYSLAYNFNESKVLVTVASGASTFNDEKEGFNEEYQVSEPMLIGKSKVGNANPFNGTLHELRIWNKILSEREIAVNRNKTMMASTSGLLANWPFNEARGDVALDIVKVRQAKLNTGWKLDPSGASIAFNGTDQYLESNGIGSFNTEQNFTIEFWFKTSSSADMTIFSNGKGDGTDDNANGWSINLENGAVVIENNGESISSSGLDLADNGWHHLALVVNRVTNTQLFIDGELNASVSSDSFSGFSNDKFYYGRRTWKENNVLQSDQYFSGLIDEFRLWRTNRSQSEIEFNQYNKLNGDELGLVLYYPFEAYVTQAGILISQNSNESGVSEAGAEANFTNNATYNSDVPAIRLPRPLSSVSFNYSANEDKIILTTNEDNYRLENVILTVGVRNIKDLNGNILDAPLTWTAFVDRNDVVWLEDDLTFKKPVNDPYSFTTNIVNNGGLRRNFSISNLPFWLTASPSNGTIEPTKSKTITFTVNEGLNIGEYNEFIHLTTDFGFDEKLNLELSVFKAPPADWVVNSSKFQSSMSVVAQIKINDIFSRDTNDLIAAFVDGQCRGVAPLRYFQSFDNYQAFLSVYTDVTSIEDVVYKVWDASEGKIYAGIEVSEAKVKALSPDAYYGSPASPVVFSAGDFVEQNLNVTKGWQWISFNLDSDDLSDVNTVLEGYEAEENDQIKSLLYFDQYDPDNGWIGTLSANGGIKNEEMYKINASNEGMLSYAGSIIDAPSTPISLNSGWNWVGFYGQQNQDINEALSNLTNLSIGDRIKGQRDFAVYGGQGVGWVGSLQSLKPGEGYMYLAQSAGTLTYPEVSRRVSGANSKAEYGWATQSLTMDQFEIDPGAYEFNMNFILEVDTEVPLSEQSAVLVKSNDQYVGFGTSIIKGGDLVYFVTIYGERPEGLSFELIQDGVYYQLESSHGQSFSFGKNQNIGSLEAPEPFLLKEVEVNGEIIASIIPNPFNTEFRVEWQGYSKPNKLLLTNSRGAVVEVVSSPSGQYHTFDLSSAPNGVYLVRLEFAEGLKVVKAIKAN